MESQLHHVGYGAAFNTLTLSADRRVLSKRSRTPYGHAKLLQEIAFYEFLRSSAVAFPVPRLLHVDTSVPEYAMDYIQDAPTLASVFPTLDYAGRCAAVDQVRGHLRALHAATKRHDVGVARLRDCIAAECFEKLHRRYTEIADVLDTAAVEIVNGLRVPTMPDAIAMVYRRIQSVFGSGGDGDGGVVCAIHGDCHFNNILVRRPWRPGGDLVFLDPRGQFGDLAIYGPAAYDFAKVRFALTGYSVFDAMTDAEVPLEMDGAAATVGDLFQLPRDEVLGGPDDLETLFVLTIWLGNAHCFRSAPRKAVFSALYARWLVAVVLGGGVGGA